SRGCFEQPLLSKLQPCLPLSLHNRIHNLSNLPVLLRLTPSEKRPNQHPGWQTTNEDHAADGDHAQVVIHPMAKVEPAHDKCTATNASDGRTYHRNAELADGAW